MNYCNFADVEINGHFNDCSLEETTFEGAIPGTYYNYDCWSEGFYFPVPVNVVWYCKSYVPEEYPYLEEDVYDESDIIKLEDFYPLNGDNYDRKWINNWMDTIFATAIEEQLKESIEKNNKLIRK